MAVIDINLNPSRPVLRQFGVIAMVFLSALGLLVFWRRSIFGWEPSEAGFVAAWVCWGIGLMAGVFSLVYPRGNRLLWILLTCVSYPIGLVVSMVLMAIVFYGLFTPLGLVFRLIGRDPLQRSFEPECKTYWTPHRPAPDASRYFRQF